MKSQMLKIIEAELGSSQTMNGTELIELFRKRGLQAANATFRYHLTQIANDPTSPLAKISGHQGYYLRPESEKSLGAEQARVLQKAAQVSMRLVAHIRSESSETPRQTFRARTEMLCRELDSLVGPKVESVAQ